VSASAHGDNVAPVLDLPALSRELGRAIAGEVRFDDGSRALYATDASNYRQVPIGVVIPRTIEDVIATVAICRRFGAPLLNRGAGTSLSGQTCNVAVVVDMSKYLNRVLEVDPQRRIARVQPGVVLDDLRAAAEQHRLTFAPDPATHNRCTLGGMIGNNSCGVHSVMAGKTDANVHTLDVLTYRGERVTACSVTEAELDHVLQGSDSRARIYRELRELRDRYEADIRAGFPGIPRRVSGFDLPHLLPEAGFNVAGALVGTEGTCVTVLEATLRLVSSPPFRTLLVLGYGDVFQAADAVPEILTFGPIGLEGMDDRLVEDLRQREMYPDEVALLPTGRGWLLVEFGGESKAESDARAERLIKRLKSSGAGPALTLCATPAEARRFWELREAGLGVGALVPGKFMRWPGWDDSAVAPEKMGAYLRDLQRLMDQHGLDGAFYGHFGEGCLHIRYNFDFSTHSGVARFRAFLNDAADLVVSYGGSLSGEHGDGQAHGELLSKMYGPRLMKAFKEFKAIWDPDGKMNPGKVLDARAVDEDLRVGPAYQPPSLKTHFSYPEDAGSFSMANLRCVGVGKCRRHDSGTMCPSYMATREEEHSTRGRARLLFEMLEGSTVRDGWHSDVVRDALDLCLACKACKSECPVGVDMATYKAEFLSHYYHRRLRPRAAYAMGLIHWWARAASIAPSLVNVATRAPFLSSLIKRAGGIAPERQLPKFASQTFRAQFAKRGSAARGQAAQRTTHNAQRASRDPQPATRRVVLWPDTFNNHFHPETALAAASVLESCGFTVFVPKHALCCGRPLYDFGMLDLAKHQLRRILRALQDDIRAGTPIVVLEPSCASVFRDELLNLFPKNPDAVRLSSKTFLLGEFLAAFAADHDWPQLPAPAIVHGHCHQKSVLGMKGEESILRALGLDYRILDSGCCGMAGAFGFEETHYDVSVQVGELRLLPAVREASDDTLIIADGFSCREQISQLTGRYALHLADVIRMAQSESQDTHHYITD
jgi:FAD/FMN-containing dehydrogenase/Fe-S oxidoreductase